MTSPVDHMMSCVIPQVTRLLEELELGLIRDAVNHVSRFHHLVTLEQNRDRTTLPLDLWKMSVRF